MAEEIKNEEALEEGLEEGEPKEVEQTEAEEVEEENSLNKALKITGSFYKKQIL